MEIDKFTLGNSRIAENEHRCVNDAANRDLVARSHS